MPGLSTWFATARRDLPWRDPAAGPWAVLVSEVMLQQTPVARVLPVYREWLDRWPTPGALAASPSGEAIRAWGRLGYPRRALRLHAAATAMVERHGGRVPTTWTTCSPCRGSGRTRPAPSPPSPTGSGTPSWTRTCAGWSPATARGVPTPPRSRWPGVEELLPDDPADAVVTSAALMEFGALVCTARAPRCADCPLASDCAWRAAGYPPEQRTRRAQRYAGTDRQVRGRMLALLRDRPDAAERDALLGASADPEQAVRALAGLLADGLVVRARRRLAHPARLRSRVEPRAQRSSSAA